MTDFCVITGELRDGDRLFRYTTEEFSERSAKWPVNLRKGLALTEADIEFCQ